MLSNRHTHTHTQSTVTLTAHVRRGLTRVGPLLPISHSTPSFTMLHIANCHWQKAKWFVECFPFHSVSTLHMRGKPQKNVSSVHKSSSSCQQLLAPFTSPQTFSCLQYHETMQYPMDNSSCWKLSLHSKYKSCGINLHVYRTGAIWVQRKWRQLETGCHSLAT